MKKINILILYPLLIFNFAQLVLGQRNPPPIAPVTRDADTQMTEKDVGAKLAEVLLNESENWREFSYPEERFKARFPRTPLWYDEILSDRALGRLRMRMFMALGDTAGFGIGHVRLPYAVREKSAIDLLYSETIKGFISIDGFAVTATKDIEFKGYPATLIKGKSPDGPPVEFRVFVNGKDVFMVIVIGDGPAIREGPPIEEPKPMDVLQFISGFELLPEVAKPEVAVNPIFKSKYQDPIYESEYFGFSVELPKGWHYLEPEDVLDTKRLSAETVFKDSPLRKEAAAAERRNLFMSAVNALGFEKNSTIACNVVKQPGKMTADQLAIAIRGQLLTIKMYKSVSKPVPETVAGIRFVRFDTAGISVDYDFSQRMYVVIRKGYALMFVLSAFRESDMELMVDSLKTLTFKTK